MLDSDRDPDIDPQSRNPNDTSAGLWAGIMLAAFVLVLGVLFLMPTASNDAATKRPDTSGGIANPSLNSPGTTGSGSPSR